jgi:hypothetical protein
MLIITQTNPLAIKDNMIELLSDIYTVFMSMIVFTMTIGAIVWFIMIIIDRKQDDDFDKKYRDSRKK